jgi:hypothetical protein
MTRRMVLVLMLLAACGKKSDDAAFTGKYPGTEDGARQLLTDLRAGDAAALTAGLRPTPADYKAVFIDAAAPKAEAGYERLWSTTKAAITADPAATGIELHRATSEDLQQWTKRAEEHFPASYRKIAEQLRPGITIYQWKFTAPTIPVPKVYDGLIFVNQHWVWMPRPWRVLGTGSAPAATEKE